jgi:hypothetical protein
LADRTAFCVAGRIGPSHPDEVEQDLRAELLRRVERDQAARSHDDADAMDEVDAENLPWLQDLIARTGWPRRSAVGDDGASAAWLQITRCTGKWEPLPLRAPESVDERRAAVALGPLADYLAGSAAEGLPTPPVIRCPGCNNPVEMWLPEPGQEDTARCDGCGQTVRIRIGASRQDLL